MADVHAADKVPGSKLDPEPKPEPPAAPETHQTSPLLPEAWLQDPRAWLDGPEAWPEGPGAEPGAASPNPVDEQAATITLKPVDDQATETLPVAVELDAPTVELRLPSEPPEAVEPSEAVGPQTPRDSGKGDRLRRWSREYGGYLAAGGVTVVVLLCSALALGEAGVTWHSGEPVAATSPSHPNSPETDPSPEAAVPVSPVAEPSQMLSRRPARRTTNPPGAASPTPPPATSPTATVTATASSKPLGPSSVARLVDDYCEHLDRGWNGTLARKWPGSGAVDNWSCADHRGWRQYANMTDACVLRYGNGVKARYTDAKDPNSWRCYR